MGLRVRPLDHNAWDVVGRHFKIPDYNDHVEVTFHRPRAVCSVDVRSISGFDYTIAAIPKGFNSLLS